MGAIEEQRLIDGEWITLTRLQEKLSGAPTKHVLAVWKEAGRLVEIVLDQSALNLGKCAMRGCDMHAIETLEISEHPLLRAHLELPEKITVMNVCLIHALEWKIGWLLGEYDIGVPRRLIGDFIFRAIAEAGER